MSQWSINKLERAKANIEDAKDNLSNMGMHSVIESLDYVLDYINDELEAEEKE